MLTIRAYYPAVLPTNGVTSPPPPPPPPPGTIRPLDFDIDALPLHPPEDIPEYHPSYYNFPYPLPPRQDRLPADRNRIQFPYWGLHRYAVGTLAISTEEWYNLKTTSSWDGSVQVTYDDGAGGTDTISMRVVAAQPVSDSRVSPSGAPTNTIEAVEWRITVADQRYEWNERVFVGSGGSYATWGATIRELIIQACGQAISATTINSLLPAPLNTQTPNDAWTADRMNLLSACCLADAACAAVGLRIAVAKDGTVTVQSASTATTALTAYDAIVSPDLAFGGKVTTAERPTLLRLLEYDATGVISTDTIAYPAIAQPKRGEMVVTLPYKSGSGLAQYNQMVADWQAPDAWDATFAGFIPLTVCSLLGTWVLDHDLGVSRIVADSGRYPWPLVRGGSAAGGNDGERILVAVAEVTVPTYPPGCVGTASAAYTGPDCRGKFYYGLLVEEAENTSCLLWSQATPVYIKELNGRGIDIGAYTRYRGWPTGQPPADVAGASVPIGFPFAYPAGTPLWTVDIGTIPRTVLVGAEVSPQPCVPADLGYRRLYNASTRSALKDCATEAVIESKVLIAEANGCELIIGQKYTAAFVRMLPGNFAAVGAEPRECIPYYEVGAKKQPKDGVSDVVGPIAGSYWVYKYVVINACNDTTEQFDHAMDCCDGSGGGGGPDPTCCSVERPAGLPSTLYATGPGITGSLPLTQTGPSTYIGGLATLGCGLTVYFKFDSSGCGLSWSCDKITWVPLVLSLGGGIVCGPPFSAGPFDGLNPAGPAGGCAANACPVYNGYMVHE